jgi:hypothetical protein
MSRFVTFMTLVSLGWASCDGYKLDVIGGTRETSTKAYQWDPNATEPYSGWQITRNGIQAAADLHER